MGEENIDVLVSLACYTGDLMYWGFMNDGTVLQVLLVARGRVDSCDAIAGGVDLLDEWS